MNNADTVDSSIACDEEPGGIAGWLRAVLAKHNRRPVGGLSRLTAVGQLELRSFFLRSRRAERARALSSPMMRSSGWSVDCVHANSHGMQNIAATVWLRNVTMDLLCFPDGQGMST
jgi:hypothetical protein